MADLSNESRECAVKEIGKLINAIEGADTCFGGLFHEPKQYPNFLGPKGPRYKRDLETLPLITFIPVLEIRPTASKQIKDQDPIPNVERILFPNPGSTHQYQPWNTPTRAKSIEIRAGTVYDYCMCENYNGLQDRCIRTGCGGCLCLLPRPQCPPGKLKALQPPDADKDALVKEAVMKSIRPYRPYCCHPGAPSKWKDIDTCPVHGG